MLSQVFITFSLPIIIIKFYRRYVQNFPYSCLFAPISGDFVWHLLGRITFIARKYLQGSSVRRSRRGTPVPLTRANYSNIMRYKLDRQRWDGPLRATSVPVNASGF